MTAAAHRHDFERQIKGLAVVSDVPSGSRLGLNRIGDAWVPGSSGEFLAVTSPATGEPVDRKSVV